MYNETSSMDRQQHFVDRRFTTIRVMRKPPRFLITLGAMYPFRGQSNEKIHQVSKLWGVKS